MTLLCKIELPLEIAVLDLSFFYAFSASSVSLKEAVANPSPSANYSAATYSLVDRTVMLERRTFSTILLLRCIGGFLFVGDELCSNGSVFLESISYEVLPIGLFGRLLSITKSL